MLVSGVQQSDSVIFSYLSFQIIFCYRLLQDIEYSSLCYTGGPSIYFIYSSVRLFFFGGGPLFIYLFLFYFFKYKFIYFNWRLITIRLGCTRVPHPEPPSYLPPRTIPLGHPSAPAPGVLYPASNLNEFDAFTFGCAGSSLRRGLSVVGGASLCWR